MRSHFLVEQIRLVQEQNDRDTAENHVVHDGIEYVSGFLQSVGPPARNKTSLHLILIVPIMSLLLLLLLYMPMSYKLAEQSERRINSVALQIFLKTVIPLKREKAEQYINNNEMYKTITREFLAN